MVFIRQFLNSQAQASYIKSTQQEAPLRDVEDDEFYQLNYLSGLKMYQPNRNPSDSSKE